jgi:hypothetical protein
MGPQMHPLFLAFVVLITIGLAQRLFGGSKRNLRDATRDAIGVVLVAPGGAEVETRIRALLSIATRPAAVRVYVAKMCADGETPEVLEHMRVRVATRMYYVRERGNTAAQLRTKLVREVLEPFMLVLCWSHEMEYGWDESLRTAYYSCDNDRDDQGAVAVLTARPPTRAGCIGFLAVDGTRDEVRISRVAYAFDPPSPLPSLACTAQLLFGPTEEVQDGWPTKKVLVEGADEDAALTMHLFMAGLTFYGLHDLPVFSLPGFDAPMSSGSCGSDSAPPSKRRRTLNEFWTAVSFRGESATSRSRAGLSLGASTVERYHKLGHVIAPRRDL